MLLTTYNYYSSTERARRSV